MKPTFTRIIVSVSTKFATFASSSIPIRIEQKSVSEAVKPKSSVH
jgi:hypothetical protein